VVAACWSAAFSRASRRRNWEIDSPCLSARSWTFCFVAGRTHVLRYALFSPRCCDRLERLLISWLKANSKTKRLRASDILWSRCRQQGRTATLSLPGPAAVAAFCYFKVLSLCYRDSSTGETTSHHKVTKRGPAPTGATRQGLFRSPPPRVCWRKFEKLVRPCSYLVVDRRPRP